MRFQKILHQYTSQLFVGLLCLIFLFAFIIRLIGVYPGNPPNHPDEPITYLTAIQMALNKDPDPFSFRSYRFQYPGFLVYLDAFVFSKLFIPVNIIARFVQEPRNILTELENFDRLIYSIVGPSWIHSVFWGRYVVAVIGSLSVICIFFLGRSMFNSTVGLLASLFLAVNYRHIVSSHLSLVDAPNSTMTIFSLLLTYQLYKKPTILRYILASIGIGLALSVKLNFFVILPFAVVHLLICLRQKKLRDIMVTFSGSRLVLSVFIIGVTFLICNPFLLLHLDIAMTQQQLNNLRYGLGSNSLMLYPFWYLYEIGIGKEFSILFIIGFIILCCNKKYWVRGLLLSFLLVLPTWVLVYYSHGGGYVRNFVGIIPFIFIISSLGLYETALYILKLIRVSNRERMIVFLILMGFIMSISQLKLSLRTVQLLTYPWSSECIKESMKSILKDGDKVARTPIVPDIEDKRIQFSSYSNYYEKKGPFDVAELQDDGIEYVIVNTDIVMSYFIDWVGEGTKYWSPPYNVFNSSFTGLALKELSKYRITECIHPFPYIAENYFMMRIPKRPQAFQKTLDISIDGELVMPNENGSSSQNSMIVRKNIPIKGENRYIISAQITSDKPIDTLVRDGFIRVDYYGENNDKKLTKIASSLSSRYYGSNWKELTVNSVSPSKATFMTISVQRESTVNSIRSKDFKIYNVNDPITNDEIQRVNRDEIGDTVIYPQYIL